MRGTEAHVHSYPPAPQAPREPRTAGAVVSERRGRLRRWRGRRRSGCCRAQGSRGSCKLKSTDDVQVPFDVRLDVRTSIPNRPTELHIRRTLASEPELRQRLFRGGEPDGNVGGSQQGSGSGSMGGHASSMRAVGREV